MHADIREMFPGYRWRWTDDHEKGARFDPYHVELHGRYGTVSLHGTKGNVRLQAYTDRKLVRGRLAAINGVAIHQWGDDEATVTFRPDMAEAVFALLRIRRKPGSGRFSQGDSPENATGDESASPDEEEVRDGLDSRRTP